MSNGSSVHEDLWRSGGRPYYYTLLNLARNWA